MFWCLRLFWLRASLGIECGRQRFSVGVNIVGLEEVEQTFLLVIF